MKIRELTIKDYSKIIDLWTVSGLEFKPKGRDSRKSIQGEMKKSSCIYLGAFEKEELIGTLIVTDDGRKGWLNRLAIHPDYRRKGIAKKLSRAGEKILFKKGIGIIALLIFDHNEKSQNLAKSLGYEEHRDIVYFTKRINPDI
ncbi:MAG: GNAT family N-acetyltransferase [bacterium]|nr:GNAT family N-acetyltransferase [bacterium]